MIQFNVPVKYSLLLMTGNCGPQSCFFFFSSALCWLYIFFSSFFPITLKIKHRPSSYKCLHQNAYWLQFCGFRVLKVYPCRIGSNIRFFDHFQLPTCGGNNKTLLTLDCSYHPFPLIVKWTLYLFGDNKWYSTWLECCSTI